MLAYGPARTFLLEDSGGWRLPLAALMASLLHPQRDPEGQALLLVLGVERQEA